MVRSCRMLSSWNNPLTRSSLALPKVNFAEISQISSRLVALDRRSLEIFLKEECTMNTILFKRLRNDLFRIGICFIRKIANTTFIKRIQIF